MPTVQIDLPESVDASEAQLVLALGLFESGRLSLGQAARMAGFSKPAFMEIAGKRGVAVIDYPAEDLKGEILDA